MDIRECHDVDARVAIAGLILSVLPLGSAREGFGESIDAYTRSGVYTFLIAFPDATTGEALSDACAVAICSVYELPMANRAVLGIDGLAVRDAADAIPFLRVLVGTAAESGLHAVCLAERGVAKPGLVQALAERGRLDAQPIGVVRPYMMLAGPRSSVHLL